MSAEKIVPLVSSRDAKQVVIPKGSSLPAKVLGWTLEQFSEYTKSQGFELPPTEALLQEFRKTAKISIKSIIYDIPVIKCIDPIEPKPGSLTWLENGKNPRDLVFKDKPFLKIESPVDPKEGVDIFGHPIKPRHPNKLPAIHLDLDAMYYKTAEGLIVSLQSGQCILEGKRLRYSHVYHVEDVSLVELHEVEFPCGVKVIRDLSANINWKIHGKLEVNGHFSASRVEVFGDVVCHSGIQTNSDEPILVHGDCSANFIQMSRLGILGNLTVQQTILQSEVRVGGDITCTKGRGTVMGSTVYVFGGFSAHQAGSDEGRETKIEMFNHPTKIKRQVSTVAKGTLLIVDGVTIPVKKDMPWSSS